MVTRHLGSAYDSNDAAVLLWIMPSPKLDNNVRAAEKGELFSRVYL